MTEREFVLQFHIKNEWRASDKNISQLKEWYKKICENTSDGEELYPNTTMIEEVEKERNDLAFEVRNMTKYLKENHGLCTSDVNAIANGFHLGGN